MKDVGIIARFLDDKGRVTQWPAKPRNKNLLLEYLVSKFETSRTYSEKEVNDILKDWHTFEDWAVIRRALVDKGYMTRDLSGYEYKVVVNRSV